VARTAAQMIMRGDSTGVGTMIIDALHNGHPPVAGVVIQAKDRTGAPGEIRAAAGADEGNFRYNLDDLNRYSPIKTTAENFLNGIRHQLESMDSHQYRYPYSETESNELVSYARKLQLSDNEIRTLFIEGSRISHPIDADTIKVFMENMADAVKYTHSIASASSGRLRELLPLSSLNSRQRAIHEALASQGAVTQFRKKSVSMSDLRAIGRVTGDEYSVFTLKGKRTIIRGFGNEIKVSEQLYNDLVSGKYGKWSGHTHPPGYSTDPGPADRPFLLAMNQKRSAIWGDDGYYIYGPLPLDDAEIRSEIAREQWGRIYGDD